MLIACAVNRCLTITADTLSYFLALGKEVTHEGVSPYLLDSRAPLNYSEFFRLEICLFPPIYLSVYLFI